MQYLIVKSNHCKFVMTDTGAHCQSEGDHCKFVMTDTGAHCQSEGNHCKFVMTDTGAHCQSEGDRQVSTIKSRCRLCIVPLFVSRRNVMTSTINNHWPQEGATIHHKMNGNGSLSESDRSCDDVDLVVVMPDGQSFTLTVAGRSVYTP